MTLSIVVRLVEDRLKDGEVVGWVEDPATGSTLAVRNADELVAYLLDASGGLA